MSQSKARELRQSTERQWPAKRKPTPEVDRSHTWLEREHDVEDKDRHGKLRTHRVVQIRPSQIAVKRYGIKDLGWGKRSVYFTLTGKLRKTVKP